MIVAEQPTEAFAMDHVAHLAINPHLCSDQLMVEPLMIPLPMMGFFAPPAM
jgi:hypothetical protein